MGERRPYLAANWKMNKTVVEAIGFLEEFLLLRHRAGALEGSEPEIVVCPPYPALAAAAERCAPTPLKIAAQNMHEEPSGAYTGEVSAPMLLEIGVEAVVLGHSERRQLFGETDEALARKVPAALAAGLEPILCVGETDEERDADDTEAVLARQVGADLAAVDSGDLGSVVIAYEPIWAIGTGRTATNEQAQEAILFIRNLIGERSEEAAAQVRILYGGSVKPANASELLAEPDIDGALVGGASLEAASFAAICDAT